MISARDQMLAEMSRLDLLQVIGSARLPLTDEKETQAALAHFLRDRGIEHEREARLTPHDVPDFVLPCGLAIEIKLRSSRKRSIYDQLCRYARFPQVHGIILATNMMMGLPAMIEDKPAWIISLGRAWL